MNLFGPGPLLAILFLVAGYTIFYLIKVSHIERMAKIKKGIIDADKKSYTHELKLGILLIGIALGIFTAYIVEIFFTVKSEVIYPGLIFLFGGVSLIVSYTISKKQDSN